MDGEEAELLEANTMYMALELEEGEHEIRLVYCTPYLKAGGLLDFGRSGVLHLSGIF